MPIIYLGVQRADAEADVGTGGVAAGHQQMAMLSYIRLEILK